MKAKGIGKLHTSAEALVYTVLKKRFGKSSAAVESLPVTGDSLGSINKYLLDAADLCVLCVLCVVVSFSAIGGPR
jgi:hypothetical protein